MAGRGGCRHTPKPMVDECLLQKVLCTHSNIVAVMGPYDSISRAQAISPKGLAKVMPLLKDLVEVEPTCEIHTQCLRKALHGMLRKLGQPGPPQPLWQPKG